MFADAYGPSRVYVNCTMSKYHIKGILDADMRVDTRPSCLVCLAFLHVLPAVRAAQTCTQKFEGLTTCSTFNGAFASGSALSLNETKVLDLAFATAFDNPVNKDVKKSDQCRSLYNTFGCLRSVNAPTAAGGVQASAPCDSAGMRMKPCKALCLELTARCFPHKYKPMAEIDKECTDFSAPPGIECFGTNGVLGMKSAAPAAAPPMLAAALLAVAACLGV